MSSEDYTGDFKVGKDCLDPEMKRIRMETIFKESFERKEDSHFKGLVDQGPLTD